METYLAFIKAHERLIIVAACLALAGFLGNTALRVWDAHDARNFSTAQAKLTADAQQNAALSSQLAALQQQVSSLSIQRHAALAKQQAGDATLTPQAAAQKLNAQLNTTTITAQADNVVLPIDPARSVVSQLDELPVLRADLADQQRIVAQQTQVIASLNTTLADQANVCKAQVAELNAKHRRSVWKSIGYGIGAGFIAALLIK